MKKFFTFISLFDQILEIALKLTEMLLFIYTWQHLVNIQKVTSRQFNE